MRVLRWLRVWLSNQATLAALLCEVESERDRLAAQVRRVEARRAAETDAHRRELAAARTEIEALHAGHRAIVDRLHREVMHGTRQAHRLNAAYQFADQLPDDLAAELRDLVTPQITVEESYRAVH